MSQPLMGRPLVWRSAVVALMVVASTVLMAAGASADPQPLTYVALGDSYTAGPLIPTLDPFPRGCLRSTSNYPHLLASWFRVDSFRDVSCSGAETEDMFDPQAVGGGANPAQLDALDPSTRFVTVGIGGNDVGFSEIATGCIALVPVGTPCQDRYVVNGVDLISERIQDTRSKINEVLNKINNKSPDAKVFVVGYPSVFPEGRGCPEMPYAPRDLPYLVAKTKELNQMLSDRAAAKGATFVDIYTPSRGHDACAPMALRWAEPIKPPLQAAPVHPNAKGMLHAALAVAAAIRAES